MNVTSILDMVGPLDVCSNIEDTGYDGIVLVTDGVASVKDRKLLTSIVDPLQQYIQFDKSGEVGVVVCPELPIKTLIYSPTGSITGDFDDVRSFQDAAVAGVKKAVKAGLKSIVIVACGPSSYDNYQVVTYLGALHALYTPLEVREFPGKDAKKMSRVGIWAEDRDEAARLQSLLLTIESGRCVYRDIGGSDPERMAAPRVAEYVQTVFKGTCIKVQVLDDQDRIEKEYPLMAAVNRAARKVDRHRGCLISLEYEGTGPIEQTLMLVGKGITYDTGGADIKAGGIMAGMHRDKCGAAFVAGVFQMLSVYKPKGVKVIGGMSMVRNSVGSECYVADEIITSRAGVRVRVGNTDAEGRMAMCDVLCHMKEKAANEVNPYLFTIATLTGHVIRAYGPKYTAVLSNGPSWTNKISHKLQDTGDAYGDPFEISRLRREDFRFNAPPSEYEDVVQANNAASTMTNRGHYVPAAFMITASGLDKHGNDSSQPLPYTHLDIAGSSGPFPGVPTGAPLTAFGFTFLFNRPTSA